MKLSGYTWAANAAAKLLPYEACINSLAYYCDEVCVVYDPRYDDPGDFLGLSPKVKVFPQEHRIEKMGGNGEQLSVARAHCTGDWLIWMDLDEILHEKDRRDILNLISYADTAGYSSVELSFYSYMNRSYAFREMAQWGCRAKLTRNIPGLTHGIAGVLQRGNGEDFIGLGDGIDYMKDGELFKHSPLIFKDFPFLDRVRTGELTPHDIICSTRDFPYVYHYARYSMARKLGMHGLFPHEFHMGITDDYKPDTWIKQLTEPVDMKQYPERFTISDELIGPVVPTHPRFVAEWLKEIDNLL